MKSWWFLFLALAVGCIATAIYFQTRIPPGVEPMSGQASMTPVIAQWTAIFAFISAFFDMLTKIFRFFREHAIGRDRSETKDE